MELTWLHISDIHFHYSAFESLRLRDEFIKKIKEISKNTKIDCVFCTGDLADRYGSYHNELISYLKDIANAVGVVQKNVFIVPGNHDHNRQVSSTILDAIYEYYDQEDDHNKLNEHTVNDRINRLTRKDTTILNSAFDKYVDFCKSFYVVDDYDVNHTVIKLAGDDITITKINTSMFDRSSNDANRELHIDVKRLYETIKKEELADVSINIAIGHHPSSVMAKAEEERFLDCLSANNIHIYLCGHQHKPSFVYHNEYDVSEVVCSYGNSDDYSSGGFSIGHLDLEKRQYYVDFYNWKRSNQWVRDTTINGCDETGRCYIKGKKYKSVESSQIVVPLKLFGPPINDFEISSVIEGDYEVLSYFSDGIDINNIDWSKELSSIDKFANELKQNSNNINIFPIAPVPLLINFGFQLQQNSKLFIYQFDRDSMKWVRNSKELYPAYNIVWKQAKILKNKKLVLKIETSTEIASNQMPKIKNADIIELSMKNKKIGNPLYENQYKNMLNELFDEINPIVSRYEEMHIFASVPAGMAIEIGRHIQRSVYPKVKLYNFNRGYTYVATINN